MDHEGGADFPYPRDVVFEALLAAIPRIAGMKVDTADKLSGRIVAKAGMSLMSWGEHVPIVVSESAPGRTRVSVTSTPKTGSFGGAFDMGKNRKNIERVLAELSESLKGMPQTVETAGSRGAESDPALRLAKLRALVDDGLITSAEFEKRKAEILSDI